MLKWSTEKVISLQLESRSAETQDTCTDEEKKASFAVKVGVSSPVDDFHKKIPDMAYKVQNEENREILTGMLKTVIHVPVA